MHIEHPKFEDFSAALAKCGAEWPQPFLQNLDRLIISSHPKYTKKAAKIKEKAMNGATTSKASGSTLAPTGEVTAETERRARMFPGIARPDQEWQPIEDFLSTPGSKEESAGKDAARRAKSAANIEAELAKLDAVASGHSRPESTDFMDDGPAAKRMRYDGRDSGYAGRDNGYGGRGAGPSRGNGYGNQSEETRGRQGRPGFDARPVLYKIYSGTITGIREFGAFASLEGIEGRTEGTSREGKANSQVLSTSPLWPVLASTIRMKSLSAERK